MLLIIRFVLKIEEELVLKRKMDVCQFTVKHYSQKIFIESKVDFIDKFVIDLDWKS